MSHLLMWGNGYAQIVRNGHGQVLGLYFRTFPACPFTAVSPQAKSFPLSIGYFPQPAPNLSARHTRWKIQFSSQLISRVPFSTLPAVEDRHHPHWLPLRITAYGQEQTDDPDGISHPGFIRNNIN